MKKLILFLSVLISVSCSNKESKTNEDNGRRDFMRKAAATAGAVALGTMAPSTAWPDEPPENFDFMDKFFSKEILNDPKYREFKLKGTDFLNMIKDLEKKWKKRDNKNNKNNNTDIVDV